MATPEASPPFRTSSGHSLSPTNSAARQRTRKPSPLSQSQLNSSSSFASSPDSSSSNKRKRRKARSFIRRSVRFAIKHTWTIPLILLLVFAVAYAVNPGDSNIIHRFIFLSYKQPNPNAHVDPTLPPHYGKGLWDIAFVSFYTLVLSFTREMIVQELLLPLARYNGIKSRGKQMRFAEQMYTALYFSIMGPVGIYVMSRSPVWYFNTRGMYEGFPHRTHEASFKFYYLFQAAYWAQQGIVMLLGIEKPRKDFKELVAHHIVTLALIGLSYRFHFTYMGIAVYLTHDLSDVFLALSKSLLYINSPWVGPVYITNMAVWIYLRHYINLRILYSILTEFRTVGPYGLDWETQQYKCWISNAITFTLLASLQALNLFWLYCLLRSLYKFVVLRVAKDDRSEESEGEGSKLNANESAKVNGNGVSKKNDSQ